MVNEFRLLLLERVRGVCEPGEREMDLLEAHFRLLLRWNRKMNLTSLKGTADIVEKHYCESLFVGACLPAGALRIMDAGSGAGFPGVPVAIYRSDCEVVLVESARRKAVFLRESTRELANVRVFAGRVEELAEVFDWGLSRAVAWKDLEIAMASRCRMAGLLVKRDTVMEGSRFEWQPRMPLPWDPARCLVVGTNVSRETSVRIPGSKAG